MPVVFVFVLGVVVGFTLCVITRRVVRDAEAAQKARIAREEAATVKKGKR